MKCCSFFQLKPKMEFQKFNCFFINSFRYSFRRIKVISTVVEKERERECEREGEYTPDIN